MAQYEWKDPDKGARALRLVLWGQIVMFPAWALLSDLLRFWVSSQTLAVSRGDESDNFGPIAAQGLTIVLIGGGELLVSLAFVGGIAFGLMWIFRVTANTRALNPTSRDRPWLVVLSFLAPAVNLWVPFRAIIEAWRRAAVNSKRWPRLVIAWWVTLWLAILAMVLSGPLTLRIRWGWAASTVADEIWRTFVVSVSVTLVIATLIATSAYLFLRIVRSVNRAQKAAHALATFG